MKTTFSFYLLIICGTLAGLLPVAGRAGVPVDTNKDAPQAPPPAATATEQNPAANPQPLSAGIEDIVKLAKAGLNESVILSFIKCSEVPYQLSAEEVVRLNESGVSAALIAALLHRGEELRPRAAEAEQQPAQPSAQSARAAREETPMRIYYTRPPVQVIYLPSSSYSYGSPYYGSSYYSRSYYGSSYNGSCYPSSYGYRGYYGGYRGNCYSGYRGYYGGYRGGYRNCR